MSEDSEMCLRGSCSSPRNEDILVAVGSEELVPDEVDVVVGRFGTHVGCVVTKFQFKCYDRCYREAFLSFSSQVAHGESRGL